MNRPALIEKCLNEVKGKALLCGHTHKGGIAEAAGKRVIFCPSVGLPPGSPPRVEVSDARAEARRVEIPHDDGRL